MTVWREVAITDKFVRGLAELERTETGIALHRLPRWARNQTSDLQLAIVEARPAGARLAFGTAATAIELTARATKRIDRGLPARPNGIYELVIDGKVCRQATLPGGSRLVVDNGTVAGHEPGDAGTLVFADLPSGTKNVELWLPHNEITELVSARANAPVRAQEARQRIWLHHGSSISQGQDATTPTGTWPAVVSSLTGLNLLNLSFGGGALLDPFIARVIRDTPADVISLEIGINLVNRDLMRRRAFGPAVHGFLDTIRDGHPDTPIVVISPLLCPIHETHPGPTVLNADATAGGTVRYLAASEPASAGQLTLELIRADLATLAGRRRTEDRNLYYIDGRRLYGPEDFVQMPLPDGLHPAAASHRLIGEHFAEYLLDNQLRMKAIVPA